MSEPESQERAGLPGGIALPAALFVVCAIVFAYTFANPGIVDLGPNLSPSAVCVLGGVVTLGWLLVAVGKRRPPEPR